MLVLLDSFPPDPRLHTDVPRRSPWRWLRDNAGLVVSTLRGGASADRYWRFYRQSRYLHRHYRTAPWPGDALVVVAESPEKAQRSLWDGHLSGRWDLVHVTGDHLTMLRPPHVACTATAVAAALDRADAGRGTAG
jgi:thioesterase domain-containing protein